MALPESIAKFVAVIAGGSSTPAVPAGYFRWYDASDANRVYSDAYTTLAVDTDPIYVVEDKFSADGTNGMLQTILGARPIWIDNSVNGLHSAYHDGGMVLEGVVDGTSLTDLAVGVVFRTGSSIAAGTGYFSWADSSGSSSPFVLIRDNGTGMSLTFFVSGGYRWTLPIAVNTTYVIVIGYDSGAGEWKLKVNGVDETPYSGGLTNQANANSFYSLSGFGGAGIGYFCEAIVYDENAIVTTIDDLCDNVSSYLISKWGA